MDAKFAKEREGRQGDEEVIASAVVDAAVAIHKVLGPGLLESAYVAALSIELADRGLAYENEVAITATYRGKPLGVAYRADLVVASRVLVEVKSVETLASVHFAQTLSYLRLSGLRLGLLLNFSVPLMKLGIKRIVNRL